MRYRLFLATALSIAVAGGRSLNAQQSELRTLANGLAQDIASAGKKSIAVVDFVDLQGNTSELGRFLAEEFSVALVRTRKGFEVVDRNHLKAVLAEHKLTASGLIDPTTAQKIGQFTGADAIVTGSMTPFSESVRIAVKVLATDTARIIAADDTDLPKTQTIAELLGNTVGPNSAGGRGSDRPASARPGSFQLNDNPVTVRPPSSQGPSSTPGGSAAPARPPSSPVVLAELFQYELLECTGTASAVRCSFQITNRGPDRDLLHSCGTFNARTKAYDNFGNESAGQACTIANKGPVDGEVLAHLVTGVPVRASVLFQNLGTSASSLSLITISGAVGTQAMPMTQHVTASFRNVPIAR